MKKLVAVYQTIIGIGMIGIWILLFSTNQIPEFETEPIRIILHITAEIVTGFLLIGSGIWLIMTNKTHPLLFNLSFGCLLYTLIASPGYYAQNGDWGVLAAFLIMLIITAVLLWKSSSWN